MLLLLINFFFLIKETQYFLPCFSWDPKKRMTPEEAVRHEFLQPSGNTSYNHTKSMRPENAENQHVSPKSSAPKYGRPPHLTPNSVLPDIKSATINKYTTKSYKERTKSKELWSQNNILQANGLTIRSIIFLGLALSANDLEAVQHYSINRLYPSVRKMYTTTSGLMPTTASAVNIKFATINHHHTNGGSTVGSMSHSQSTGDVASIFGRAWPKVVGSLFGTSVALNKQHSEEEEE